MLRAVVASLSLLFVQSTAAQVDLLPAPWATAEIAFEGPFPPVMFRAGCQLAGGGSCFDPPQLEVTLDQGGALFIDNEHFTYQASIGARVEGNAAFLAISDTQLTMKKPIAHFSNAPPGSITSFDASLFVVGRGVLSVPSTQTPVQHLAFVASHDTFDLAERPSAILGAAHTEVVPFLSGDEVSVSGFINQSTRLQTISGQIEFSNNDSCSGSTTDANPEMRDCEISIEAWEPRDSAISDSDSDGVPDAADNCTTVPNGPTNDTFGNQTDADGDGFGDPCDCDFNNDGKCDIADFSQFLPSFVLGSDQGVGADMNVDGTVDIGDYSLFLPGFTRAAPGPAGPTT